MSNHSDPLSHDVATNAANSPLFDESPQPEAALPDTNTTGPHQKPNQLLPDVNTTGPHQQD